MVFFVSCSSLSIVQNENLAFNIFQCDNIQNTLPDKPQKILNEVIVIGHFYGSLNKQNNEIPKKIKDYFVENNSNDNTFIALTGDIVKDSTVENFKKVEQFLKLNSKEYFISPGNHDINPSINNYFEVFEKDFFHKEFNNFLLIAANFSNPNWLPTNDQIVKVNDLINSTSKENIILLSHQIFWLNDIDFEFNPNSFSLLETELKTNSLEWIELENKKNIITISGDSGAWGQETMCYVENNKLFIANGIGGYSNDTIIKISETRNLIIIEEIPLN